MSQTGRERREPPFLSESTDVTSVVPKGLRVSAALSWRVVVVVAALWGILWLLGYLASVVVPVSIALLLSALLAPGVARLVKWRVPRGLATAIMLILAIVVLGGLLTFVITQFSSGLPQLQVQLTSSLNQIRDWVINTFHVRQEQIQHFLDQAIGFLQLNQSWITSTALTTASTVGEILTGFVLTLFVTIFFLAGGDGIWNFLVRGAPRQVRSRVNVAGRRGFASLVSYIRATTAVAVVDAVGIGIGLWAVGVPLVIPLATLVFLGAFIPIIGAVIAGGVAVLIALVTNGVIGAVIVLAIVIAVMQLESHILQPLLLGRAVKLHPLAVVLAIATGLVAAGIAGALLSVPLLAVLNAGIRSLLHESGVDPADVDALRGRVPDAPKDSPEEPEKPEKPEEDAKPAEEGK
ncbi:putative PurR-regulated permease PerM [Amycolatopsis sulphurea]|uniref:Putative PurR-regulated permease PerM n=1 Tax=Amycolatopsis sulphurea TaxID=76022 RepID=A0A2A9FBP1_9PSEU|nr:AI-2E family transporter [Amycolatopsis sulphurea]PFG48353.1 putative PurR-regulated permease PerM [Amycolatopsis sulphurea]